MRKLNNTYRKEAILKLRKQGKTYSEIQKALGCSKSTISYHCGNGNEKLRVQAQVKKRKPICKKVSSFKGRCTKADYRKFRSKLKTFRRRSHSNKTQSKSIVNNISKNYSCQDVINKIGASPICYLTGARIDLNKPQTYNLDHIVPSSKGGTNDLDNLGICLKEANQAKGDLTISELIQLCKAILKHQA